MQDMQWPRPAGEATFLPLDWPPTPAPAPSRRRRRGLVVMLVVVLLAACGASGYLAWHDHQVGERWRSLEGREAATAAAAQAQTRLADSRISELSAQVTALDAQMTSLQGQLSTVADQKEKAVDQEAVLQRLLADAGQVATDLQQCITDTDTFDSSLNAAVANGDLGSFGQLQGEADAADSTCNSAEAANQNLQAAISSTAS